MKIIGICFILIVPLSSHAAIFYFGGGGDYFSHTQHDLSKSVSSFNETLFKKKDSVGHQYKYGFHVNFGVQGESFLHHFRFDLSASHNRQDLTHPHAKTHVTLTFLQLFTKAFLFAYAPSFNPFASIGLGGFLGRGTYLQDVITEKEPSELSFSGPGFIISGMLGLAWLIMPGLSLELAGGYRYGFVPLVYADNVPKTLFPKISSGEVIQLKHKGESAKEFHLNATGFILALSLFVHL